MYKCSVCGSDVIHHNCVEVLAERIAKAELLLVKGDHFGALNPTAISAIVDFLA